MSASTELSQKAAGILEEITRLNGRSPSDVMEAALDAYHRCEYIRIGNEGYAAWRADPVAWAEHLAERMVWDEASMDGLDEEEVWTPDGNCQLVSKSEKQPCPTHAGEKSGTPILGLELDTSSKAKGPC